MTSSFQCYFVSTTMNQKQTDLLSLRTFPYLDLLHTRPLEPQVEAVVGERADLHVVAVVTHADDGDLGAFDQTDHLLHALHIRQIIVNGCKTIFFFK